MIVKKVRLRNFRNYSFCEFEFSDGINVITGKNAQGKTNLIESLIYLSLTRSHRILNDKQLIKDGYEFADIKCRFIDQGSSREIEAIIHQKGKTLMVQHQPVKKSSEFVGLLNVVLFSPDDLNIFTDAPKDRRKIMNQELSKTSSKYLNSLSRFNAILKERNLLLKRIHVDTNLLDTFDEQMSELECNIIQERKVFINTINQNICDIYKKLSDDTIRVQVKYNCCLENDVSIENILFEHKKHREKDIENHVTTFGIHREDFTFEMNDRNLVQFASQGQKRMTVLSFKMSLLKYITIRTHRQPILLLDDVLSELDLDRQNKLMDMVGGSFQCLITATEIPEFLKNKKMKIFQIDHGNIQSITGGEV